MMKAGDVIGLHNGWVHFGATAMCRASAIRAAGISRWGSPNAWSMWVVLDGEERPLEVFSGTELRCRRRLWALLQELRLADAP